MLKEARPALWTEILVVLPLELLANIRKFLLNLLVRTCFEQAVPLFVQVSSIGALSKLVEIQFSDSFVTRWIIILYAVLGKKLLDN